MTEHNDEFDRSLAKRLQGYENRVPAGAAPDLSSRGSGASSRRRVGLGWGALVATGGVAAGLILVLTLNGRVSPPTGQASPTAHPSSSGTASATATSVPSETQPAAIPTGTDLQWTEAGSFGEAGAAEIATAVTRGMGSFVAVGTHYDQAFWDSPGPPPPHEGRVWVSPDGRSWANVTPPATFANAILNHVFTTADRSFIAIGRVTPGGCDPGFGCEDSAVAWESADGLNWRRVESSLPAGFTVDVEHGARGYVATACEGHCSQVWFSADGRAWEQVYDTGVDEGLVDIGAGDQGFVAVGWRGTGDATEGFVIASADGREWIVASTAPSVSNVAPVGGDWFALAGTLGPEPGAPSPVWFSTNGLEWSEIGTITLETFGSGQDHTCYEVPSRLLSAAGGLVVRLAFSFPCSEAENVTYGRTLISVDGMSWEALPFAEISPTGRGSGVFAAISTEGGLLLVGQSNGRAAFWLGEVP